MIFKLEIENFLSFREKQVLDLRAPASAPRDTDRLAGCWSGSNERAPKVITIYGANGSGKSNLLRAISFIAWFVGSSFDLKLGSRIPLEPFNDEESYKQPTRLKVWLSWSENHRLNDSTNAEIADCPYCYEVVIGNEENRKVLSESIYFWPTASGRKTRLIERFNNGDIKTSADFGNYGYSRVLKKILRPNASIISTLAQLNHPIAVDMAAAVGQIHHNILIEKMELSEETIMQYYMSRPELLDQINREINRIDVGVRSLEIANSESEQQILFRHAGLSYPMPTLFESHGTRQFMKFFPLISDTLATGSIAIIDELDAAIHPLILTEIIDWFHDPIRNPHSAQLWASCHNTSLLEELSKDEIVFCEKNRLGRTEIFGLNAIKGVRRDENYYKKYLGGVYGAVPRLG